jgi:hypothetical protein
MRFIVLVKATEDSEAGAPHSEEGLSAMYRYNEELVKAGVLLGGEGLRPTSSGARVRFSPDGTTRVIDGPFTEAKELVAGFWILQVRSKDEAIEWARRIPNPPDVEWEVEIRQLAELDDFGDAATPQIRAQDDRLRAQVAEQQQ